HLGNDAVWRIGRRNDPFQISRQRDTLHAFMGRAVSLVLIGILIGSSAAVAQTTLGLISGTVVGSTSGAPKSISRVTYRNLDTHTEGTVRSSPTGFFILPLLSPGMYQVRVEADKYQGQELQDLELSVASFLEVNFRLRPFGDVWEQGQYR